MRKFFLLTTFFSVSPLVLLVSLFALLTIFYHNKSYISSQRAYTNQVSFATLPSTQNVFGDTIQSQDARSEILRQFFAQYHSPLEPFAQNFVDTAGKYNLDFRLLPAIAMQETNLCLKSHADSFNCWGFGVHGGRYMYFNNYPEAIDTISKTLAEKYRDQNGLVTPEEIQTLYNPTNTNSWATNVDQFMDQLQ